MVPACGAAKRIGKLTNQGVQKAFGARAKRQKTSARATGRPLGIRAGRFLNQTSVDSKVRDS